MSTPSACCLIEDGEHTRIGELDDLPLLSQRGLVAGRRYCIDAAGNVIQRAQHILGGMPSLLEGDGSEDQLKAVFDAMLRFTKQRMARSCASTAAPHARSLARFGGVALYECGDERGGGGQGLDRVLTEIARPCAVDIQHAQAAPAVSTGR